MVITVLQSMATGVSDEDLYYGYLGEFLAEVRLPEEDGGPELEVQARGTQNAKWLEGARSQFLGNVVRHLQSRFPDHSLMHSFYTLLNAPGYPERADELHEFLEPHAELVVAHYSKIGTLHEVDFTVIEDYKVNTLLTYDVVPTVMFAAPP